MTDRVPHTSDASNPADSLVADSGGECYHCHEVFPTWEALREHTRSCPHRGASGGLPDGMGD